MAVYQKIVPHLPNLAANSSGRNAVDGQGFRKAGPLGISQ